MSFTSILNLYLTTLETIEDKYHRDLISSGTRDCLLSQNRHWYQEMCLQEGVKRYTTVSRPNISEAEHQKYDIPGMPVDELIVYRDNVIPCYDDDAGQQEVALIRGHVTGGGAYNFNYIDTFCDTLDYYLEEEYIAALNEKYK